MKKRIGQNGFTIIELIIITVVIAILAIFAFVSYVGIVKKADREAIRASTRSIVRTAQAFEYQNPGNHKFYFKDGVQYNADGLRMNYTNDPPGDGITIINENERVAVAFYKGVFCATKSADTDVITVSEIPKEDCATYDVINTCDEWVTIALRYDTPLDVLLSYNDESDSGSSTCGRDIKIPVEVDDSGCDDFGVCYKTYYSIGYIDSSTTTPYNYTYTIKLGNLPLPLSSINNASVSAKSVLSTLDDFKNYIVRRNLGDVLWYPSETTPTQVSLDQAPIFQAHSATSNDDDMVINSVSVSCDASQCLANVDVTANDISSYDPYTGTGGSIIYMPLKFTVEFNGATSASCFAFNSGTGTITDYYYTNPGCSSVVKIPSSIGGVNVIALGSSSFASNGLTSVEIPSTVATIGASAFKSNSIASLVVPSTVNSVGNQAFAYNPLGGGVIWNSTVVSAGSDNLNGAFKGSTLSSISFGNNVTRVPDRLLSYASPTFHSYTFPDHITATGIDSFRGAGLTSVNLNKLVNIGGWTFKEDNLTSISIPSSTTTIGEQAFINNQLASLTVPSTVTSVGNQAFAYNPLVDGVTWNAAITSAGSDRYNGAFRGSTIGPITFGTNVTRIPNRLFCFANATFSSYTIPDHITETGIDSLRGMGLTSVNLNNLIIVGGWTFKENDITSISIPSNVTTIGQEAFDYNQLSSVTVPSTVTSMSAQAFAHNPLTGGVTWNTSIASIGDRYNGPFLGSTIGSIAFGAGVTRVTSYLFCGSDPTFSSYTVPDTITTLGNDSYRNMGLTSVTIPSNVTVIEGWVFKENSLTSITIPSSITSLGQEALQTNSLTSITMESGSTVIGSYLLTSNNDFRTTYTAGGAGTYTGTQTGTWTKL